MNPQIIINKYHRLELDDNSQCYKIYSLDKYKYMKYYPVEENAADIIIDFWSDVIRTCVKVVQKAIKLFKK